MYLNSYGEGFRLFHTDHFASYGMSVTLSEEELNAFTIYYLIFHKNKRLNYTPKFRGYATALFPIWNY